jgi:hypothetical protein
MSNHDIAGATSSPFSGNNLFRVTFPVNIPLPLTWNFSDGFSPIPTSPTEFIIILSIPSVENPIDFSLPNIPVPSESSKVCEGFAAVPNPVSIVPVSPPSASLPEKGLYEKAVDVVLILGV